MRFWGVRGSVPSPGPETARYGGNTPCVEVCADGQRLIFDLGTGVRELGEAVRGPLEAHVFLSHYHYDHLQGLPFFGPAFDPRSHLVVHGPTREGRTVGDVLGEQMRPPFFPVTSDVFRARIDHRPIRGGGRVRLGALQVRAAEANHPGGSLTYRVDYLGRSVVYATDVEHGRGEAAFLRFARGADLLIFDAMYTDDEYRGVGGSPRVGWGHSTWQQAVRLADAAQVGTLALFHHEPTRSDDALDELLRQARRLRRATVTAKEGLVIRL